MKIIVITAINTQAPATSARLTGEALKAVSQRVGDSDVVGIAVIEGEIVRPAATARFAFGRKRYNVVPLTRGLSAILVRPKSTGLTPIVFGMTPDGQVRVGKPGQVSFESTASAQAPREVLRWIHYGETGLSSEAMCRAIYGVPGTTDDEWSHPSDPDDLRRCLRFLDNCPDARDRLHLIAQKSPQWKALVGRWDELETLYRTEAPTGICERTYALMKALTNTREYAL